MLQASMLHFPHLGVFPSPHPMYAGLGGAGGPLRYPPSSPADYYSSGGLGVPLTAGMGSAAAASAAAGWRSLDR